MLSSFESALLDRHLRKCASCRAFADATAHQTELLRGVVLEPPPRPIELPERASHRLRAFTSAGAAVVVAAAVAVATFSLGNRGTTASSHREIAPAGKQFVVYPAQPTPNESLQVPRLRVEPVTYADGPVHGLYSQPA
jgi:predicted anti-sigma-YlaC factor YlaD